MEQSIPNFAGLRVAALESRRAEEIANLIRRFGGEPVVAPSMREVATASNRDAIDFANRLMTGGIDVVLFLTGTGVRHLLSQLERQVDRERFLATLSDVVTIARGPKPAAALKELGLTPTHRTSEPHTWREVLAVADRHVPLANQVVAMQEYGEPNASLVAGLEARGARVVTLKVYRWELPEDTGPLEQLARSIAVGEIDVLLFTSSHQAVNLLRIAERLHLADELQRGLQHTVIASIGPDTSETLRDHGLTIDLQPEHPQMGQLVASAAERAGALKQQKQRVVSIMAAHAEQTTGAPPQPSPQEDSLFLRACRRQRTERTPIWLMRQAGRYLPEYRAVRDKVSFMELCKNPQLCAEVMIATVNRLSVDAAIIFADLLPILEPMGMELEFAAGEGPVIHNPVRDGEDVDRVVELESVEALGFVMETVRLTRAGLPASIPVIGFAGAPFTLASYVIEGGASRNYLHTKTLIYRDRGAWDALMSRLARSVARYVNAQIAAGAQCVQLFDSWVGCLGVGDYREFVLPQMKSLIAAITPGVPVINFGTGNPALLPLMSEAGGDVIGVDWRIELADAWRAVGYEKAVQGNLDPLVLFADREEIRRRAHDILEQAAGRPGHIFNLGHGILPQTPVDSVLALIDTVKSHANS
ncbi:MAG: uroporphyrinogen decarboxylase [Pirellulales bacterium]